MKILVDENKRIADMVKNCNKAREEEVKISVDKWLLDEIIDILSSWGNPNNVREARIQHVYYTIKEILVGTTPGNHESVMAKNNTNTSITPEETVEFLIEITDTLAAYLWNKKEEVTTHQYAKYLDELREKLEEYNK